ncbi:carbon storage regulator CsrA [Nostocoides sp. HKS02]|uniref:carbon storage regulator CsrA n=1 Tax=Nostocoides sp. HKS02 TaxID=1813880 RepID=UPI0012B4C957|nr:carbon storage regulator CsrA [Tetrasphaera sp. HKS02]QGN58033.1 carbon storage regulator CsrA [Tetrasphaera sp. HKS02]
MLVLSRRPYESFRIGHDVVITVLEVNGDKVRIGIDAPPQVQVHRQEIYDEVQRANADAAAASPSATTDLARAVRGATKGLPASAPASDADAASGADVVDGPGSPEN